MTLNRLSDVFILIFCFKQAAVVMAVAEEAVVATVVEAEVAEPSAKAEAVVAPSDTHSESRFHSFVLVSAPVFSRSAFLGP